MEKVWRVETTIMGKFNTAGYKSMKRKVFKSGTVLNTTDPDLDYFIDTAPSGPKEKPTPFERWRDGGAIRLSSPLLDVLEQGFDPRDGKPKVDDVLEMAAELGIKISQGGATGKEIESAWAYLRGEKSTYGSGGDDG